MASRQISADARAIRDKYNADLRAAGKASASNAAAERFEMIPIRQLFESALNPRKHFNQHKLDELAASIRDRGVITPLIVRPAPFGEELVDGSTRLPMFEIGAGHRRYRASMSLLPIGQKGGYRSLQSFLMPCRVLDLDDEAFIELLTIENDQREDVHPLEQADGYKVALTRNGYDVATLADKIGKSEAYVRGRLELCELVPVVRESFLRDAITIGHARLISRLPANKQESALEMCFEDGWNPDTRQNEPRLVTVAEFRRELKRSQGADLSTAPFTLEERIGGVGPCTECPKCSGVQRSLIADDTADQVCFDRACYDGKVKTHVDQLAAQGFIQISNNSTPAEGVLGYDDYVEVEPPTHQIEQLKAELADVRADSESSPQEIAALEKELAELEAENWECPHMEKAVYVAGERHSGAVMNICRNPQCEIHGSDLRNSLEVKSNRASIADNEEWQRQQAERDAERKINVKARKRAWETLLSSMGTAPKLDRWFLQIVAAHFYHRFNEDFCKAFGIDWKKGDQARDKGREWTETASDAQLARAIIAAAFWEPGLQEWFNPEYGQKDSWALFTESLKRAGTSFEAIQEQVKAELQEAAAEKKKGAGK